MKNTKKKVEWGTVRVTKELYPTIELIIEKDPMGYTSATDLVTDLIRRRAENLISDSMAPNRTGLHSSPATLLTDFSETAEVEA